MSEPNSTIDYAASRSPFSGGFSFTDERRGPTRQAELFKSMTEAEQVKLINKLLWKQLRSIGNGTTHIIITGYSVWGIATENIKEGQSELRIRGGGADRYYPGNNYLAATID